jgi:hypothetical protein
MTDEPMAMEGASPPSSTGASHDRWDALAAIVLALAAVLSAWAAYEATRWSGEQADSYAISAATRADAARHGTLASRNVQVDVASFIGWSQAIGGHDERLSTFLAERFRPEFKTAFDAWLSIPFEAPAVAPPGTPFALPEYQLAEQTTADALTAQADAALVEAQKDNQIADNFVLVAVIFASVLFMAGIASRFSERRIKAGLTAVAAVLFVLGMMAEFLLPQNIGL